MHTQDGIIAKLKEYDAYIDNELPDYIIVMLANKKTMLQIKNDLQLFLGNNTEQFTDWLQRVLSSPELLEEPDGSEEVDKRKNQVEVSDEEDDTKPKVVKLPGGKEKKSTNDVIELHIQESQADSLMSHEREGEVPKSHDDGRRSERDKEGQRSRLTLRKKTHRVQVSLSLSCTHAHTRPCIHSTQPHTFAHAHTHILTAPTCAHIHTQSSHPHTQPDSTRDQDLRAFIAQRREERIKHHHGDNRGRYDDESEESEEEETEKVSTSLPSVVKILKRWVSLH